MAGSLKSATRTSGMPSSRTHPKTKKRSSGRLLKHCPAWAPAYGTIEAAQEVTFCADPQCARLAREMFRLNGVHWHPIRLSCRPAFQISAGRIHRHDVVAVRSIGRANSAPGRSIQRIGQDAIVLHHRDDDHARRRHEADVCAAGGERKHLDRLARCSIESEQAAVDPVR